MVLWVKDIYIVYWVKDDDDDVKDDDDDERRFQKKRLHELMVELVD